MVKLEPKDLRVSVLLSMQRALWDVVTPGLRGVSVAHQDGGIAARFLFDHEPTDDDREDVSLAETSLFTDFPDGFDVTFSAARVPVAEQRALLDGEYWVFLRKER